MILLTGFPGFLASTLIHRLLEWNRPETQIVCLVQEKFFALAKERVSQHPTWKDRVQLIIGDITKTNLGLTKEWNEQVLQIFHLAAIYDLSVKRSVANKINVDGTKNIIQFAKKSPNLKKLEYVSTCYVSGRFPGHYFEADLWKNQTFNNYYEETKCKAEIEIQKAMEEGLAATIYRPGIIVGDSHNGKTQKFDGPYFIMQWIDRQKALALLPELGDYDKILVNVVPVDFVAEAIAKLSLHSLSSGKVYHLSDPNPPTVREFLKMLELNLDKKIVTMPFSSKLTKLSLKYIKPLRKWTKINPETIDYFTHPTIYDSTNTRHDLSYLDVECPSLESYLPQLLSYMKTVKDRPTEPMV